MVRPVDSDSDVTTDDEIDRVQRIPSKVNKPKKLVNRTTKDTPSTPTETIDSLTPIGEVNAKQNNSSQDGKYTNEISKLLKQLCFKIDNMARQQAKPQRISAPSHGRTQQNRPRPPNQQDQTHVKENQF